MPYKSFTGGYSCLSTGKKYTTGRTLVAGNGMDGIEKKTKTEDNKNYYCFQLEYLSPATPPPLVFYSARLILLTTIALKGTLSCVYSVCATNKRRKGISKSPPPPLFALGSLFRYRISVLWRPFSLHTQCRKVCTKF